MVAAIYFEKQINGETDCGMRAVNNLLQRPAYNKDTFAALAREFNNDGLVYDDHVVAALDRYGASLRKPFDHQTWHNGSFVHAPVNKGHFFSICNIGGTVCLLNSLGTSPIRVDDCAALHAHSTKNNWTIFQMDGLPPHTTEYDNTIMDTDVRWFDLSQVETLSAVLSRNPAFFENFDEPYSTQS